MAVIQGCPLSMVFIVALYVPWCRHLEAILAIEPQLYADDLKCSAECPNALFGAARFTAQCVRSVGQDVSFGKCVLLSISKAVRRAMKLWDISGNGKVWKVQLDIRDLGGILILPEEPELVLCEIGCGKPRLVWLLLVSHLLVFRSRWARLGVSIFLLVFMLLRCLVFPPPLLVPLGRLFFRAVWSCKMPLANTPAILSLLDGPDFHILWASFRMMRRYLVCCPEEEPRIFRMLDLISQGAHGHGPVHLLLTSAAEVGFAWEGDERCWVRPSLPHLGMMAGLVQHFYSSILEAWRLNWLRGRVFEELSLLIFRALYNYLTSSVEVLWQNVLRWSFVLGVFVLPILHVRELPEFVSIVSLDRSFWLRCLLWHGWLPGLGGAGGGDLWAASFGNRLVVSWSAVWVLLVRITLIFGLRLIIGMLMILLWRCRILLIF